LLLQRPTAIDYTTAAYYADFGSLQAAAPVSARAVWAYSNTVLLLRQGATSTVPSIKTLYSPTDRP